jgi:hypothetical protein
MGFIALVVGGGHGSGLRPVARYKLGSAYRSNMRSRVVTGSACCRPQTSSPSPPDARSATWRRRHCLCAPMVMWRGHLRPPHPKSMNCAEYSRSGLVFEPLFRADLVLIFLGNAAHRKSAFSGLTSTNTAMLAKYVALSRNAGLLGLAGSPAPPAFPLIGAGAISPDHYLAALTTVATVEK